MPPTVQSVVGIFVGGASRRMGGRPKGLLPAPDTGEPIVARLARLARSLSLEVALVGEAGPYVGVVPDAPRLLDRPQGVGPLGGLGALLAFAGERPAVAVACDMPYVSTEVLEMLVAPGWRGSVVAPRRAPGAPPEPFLTRYDPIRVRPALERALAAGVRSFRGLLAGLDVEDLPLRDEALRCLVDWDAPGDVPTET